MNLALLALAAFACLAVPAHAGTRVVRGDEVIDCDGGAITEKLRIVRGTVTVRNCVLEAGLEIVNARVSSYNDVIAAGQSHAFVVGNRAFAAYRAGDEAWRGLWDASPTVTLETLVIRPGSERDTVWFGEYVHGVTATGMTVHGGAATAIYMAGGSWGATIENSSILGHVHVDGSFRNVLRDNTINGWVRTYKNCGETHGGKPGRPVVTPANGNTIVGNDIWGSVHLAARQDKALDFQECSDDSPYPHGQCKWLMDGWLPTCKPLDEVYWLDYSRHNLVEGNHIGGRVIVEDDWNTVRQPGVTVEIGATMRERYLGQSVRWAQ